MKQLFCTLLLVGSHILTCWAQWTEPELLPPNINTLGDVYYSTISADGQVLCLTIDPGTYGDDDVYFSEKLPNGQWTNPVNAGPNINNAQRNLSPSITSGGLTLFYVSYDGAYRVYMAQRTGANWNEWTPGIPLPPPINRGSQFTAQISYDDSTLVFTSTGQPTICYGGQCMYSSRLQPDQSWSEPILLGNELLNYNSVYHPCLTDSGNTLVWAMFGGMHREDDIFYSFRNESGFTIRMLCDSTINTSFWDSDPSCPADGSVMYFESRRPISPSDSFGAARMYVAHRVPRSAVAPRPVVQSQQTPKLSVSSEGNDQLLLSISGAPLHQQETVELHDLLGRLIGKYSVTFSTDGKSSFGTINPISLPSGTYFISLHIPTGTLSAKHIVAN